MAAKEREFYAHGYRKTESDEEANAIIGPIERRLDEIEVQLRAKPFRGAIVDAMALAIVALRHQDPIGPTCTKFDGSMRTLFSSYADERSVGDLLLNLCRMAQMSGLFPILSDADLNPDPDLALLDIGKCFNDGSPVAPKIIEASAEEAQSIVAHSMQGARVKIKALAHLSSKRPAEEMEKWLHQLADELRNVAAQAPSGC